MLRELGVASLMVVASACVDDRFDYASAGAGGDAGGAAGSGGTSSGGTSGSAGLADAGEDAADSGTSSPPSCQAAAVGAGQDCGPTDDDDCCASLPIPGGTYLRAYSYCDAALDPPSFTATVSPFRLDKYEVTVGRFRQFLAAYPGATPALGYGEHEHIPGSGWQTSWAPPTQVELEASLDCANGTWTATPGSHEHLPIVCVDWQSAFLFCAWDGGWLPTEAEWNFAASGGTEYRKYPWGDDAPSDDLAVYTCTGCTVTAKQQPVGSKPKGAAKWGQLDLAGNVDEWNLDVSLIEGGKWCVMPAPCTDCAELSASSTERIRRGGAYDDEYELHSDVRREQTATAHQPTLGFRCARAAN